MSINYDSWLLSGPGGPNDNSPDWDESGDILPPEPDYIELRNGQSLIFEGKHKLTVTLIRGTFVHISGNGGHSYPHKRGEWISFTINDSPVTVRVYSIRGNCVRLVVNAPDSVEWNRGDK